MTSRAAAEHQARTRALARSTNLRAADAWGSVAPERVAESWTARLPQVTGQVVTAQAAAASLASPYVAGVAGASSASGQVDPAAFAGVASDGRPLASLLFQPALVAMAALAAGADPTVALAGGLVLLDMIVRTQVADAGRLATGVAMAAHPDIAGHERVVRLPACDRCVVLAGRLYRWSTGFRRHPRCDCTMEPVTSEQWRSRNLDNHPAALFERMSREEQDKRFGVAGAEAIRDGADPAQVVNARAGMKTASVGGREISATTTGITRRGTAGQRLEARFGSAVVSQFERQRRTGGTERVRLRGSKAPRLMPETIYQVAEDREHAIRLLRLHGYLL